MKKDCNNKENLCQCIDWKTDDTPALVDHILQNYEFDNLALDYTTLDQGSEIRLCQIGRCRQCGDQICIGTVIHPCELLDDTLARIYAAASKRWRWYREAEEFDGVFVGLFRGRDQQAAKLWLDLVRTKVPVHQDDNEDPPC